MVAPAFPLLPVDWRKDPVKAGILLAAAAPPLPPAERKEAPVFWPSVPPQPGPGMYQRFLPGSPATWVPGTMASDGNTANSAVFACLTAISSAFPEPPLKVYARQADGEPTELPRHPLVPLLHRPNPHHTGPELWYWTQWAKHSDGNAYWRKVRSAGSTVEEVWPLSPARVQPITTRADQRRGVFISYYRYETEPGRYEDIGPEDIVHFRLGMDDCDHRLGCSPLRRLIREVATDDETTRFVGQLLANFAVPGLVVMTPDRTMTREQAEEIKNSVTERFSGDARGRVGVLNNGATVQQFGFSPEQLDMKTLHRVPEERIAAVLRVPAVLAGLGAGLDRSIYNNAREAREAFTEQTLTGLWRSDAARIDLELLPDFDGDITHFTRFDLTDVRALQEDEDKKYARLNLGVQGKWITVNEARKDVGLPPVDGGDELAQPVPEALRDFSRGAAGNLPDNRQGQRQLPPPARAGGQQQGAEQRALSGLQGVEQKAIGVQLFPALMEAMMALAMPGLQTDLAAYFEEQRARVIEAVLQAA